LPVSKVFFTLLKTLSAMALDGSNERMNLASFTHAEMGVASFLALSTTA